MSTINSILTSPFHSVIISLRVALAPSALSDPLLQVKKQTSALLLRYQHELQGVPLTFSELHLDKGKECARIIGEFPWLHVNVTTKCLLFKPTIGTQVSGIITRVSFF